MGDTNQQPAATTGDKEPRASCGRITLILGCMFSGKTTELLRLAARHPPSRILAVKHAIDTRYSAGRIVTHTGAALSAVVVQEAREILACIRDDLELVVVDEAHFFDRELTEAVRDSAARGIGVVLTSLEPDSWGRPFPTNQRLRGIATQVIPMFAVCARCGQPADRTQRLTPIVDGNMVVPAENYEARCRGCWRPPTEAPREAW